MEFVTNSWDLFNRLIEKYKNQFKLDIDIKSYFENELILEDKRRVRYQIKVSGESNIIKEKIENIALEFSSIINYNLSPPLLYFIKDKTIIFYEKPYSKEYRDLLTSLTDKILDVILLNKKEINSNFIDKLNNIKSPHEFLYVVENVVDAFILTYFSLIGKDFLQKQSLKESDAVKLIKEQTQMRLKINCFEDFKNFIIAGLKNPIEAYSLAYLINEMFLSDTKIEIDFIMLNKFILKTLNVSLLGVILVNEDKGREILLDYRENLITHDNALNIKRLFNSKRDNYRRCPGINISVMEKIREVVFYLYKENYKNYLIKNGHWQNTEIAISERNINDFTSRKKTRNELMRKLPEIDLLHLGLILGKTTDDFGNEVGNLAIRKENNMLLKDKN